MAGRNGNQAPGFAPVGSFEQLKDYRKLTERIRELHAAGLHHFQIADALNREGFTPPRRRGAFTKGCIGDLIRRLGLTGELFRERLVGTERVVDHRSRRRARSDRGEDSLLGEAGLDPPSAHAVRKALDRVGRYGRAATSTQARGKENLLVRGEAPRSGCSQEASRPIKVLHSAMLAMPRHVVIHPYNEIGKDAL